MYFGVKNDGTPVILNKKIDDKVDDKVDDKIRLTINQQKIINLIMENPYIIREEISKKSWNLNNLSI